MSTSCHLLLLACLHALVLSCASRPELARPHLAGSNAPRSVVLLESPFSETPAAILPVANPYAPVRSPNPAVYSWQSERRAECTPDPLAAMPETGRALGPGAARGVFAALPERTSDPASRAQPVSPEVVVAGLRPAFHQCFSHWLDDHADAQGSVRLALELGCAGEVDAISAENTGVDSSTLTCLFSAVAPARFAPPAAGHATVRLPVVFKNAAR